MLIVALIGAVIFYAALYIFWETAQPQINASNSFLLTLRNMLFSMPESATLSLLKVAILVMGIYLISDAIISSSRRNRREKDRKSPRDKDNS